MGTLPNETGKIMKEIRWWSECEVEASEERIFPENLATTDEGTEQRSRGNEV